MFPANKLYFGLSLDRASRRVFLDRQKSPPQSQDEKWRYKMHMSDVDSNDIPMDICLGERSVDIIQCSDALHPWDSLGTSLLEADWLHVCQVRTL